MLVRHIVALSVDPRRQRSQSREGAPRQLVTTPSRSMG